MLTFEEFDSLQLHDLVETFPLMKGLCREPVVLRVVERTDDAVEFVATYFGITLGRWACERGKSKLNWRFG